MASFSKQMLTDQGVHSRRMSDGLCGVVKYDLPVKASGSTMTSQSHTIPFYWILDTLNR